MIYKKIFFCLLIPFSIYANSIRSTFVPGNIVDINSSSKAWLSANDNNISLYTFDSNISKKISIDVKSISNDKNFAILVTLPKDQSDINKFFIQYPTSPQTNLPYVKFGDLNNGVTVVGVDTIVKKIKENCDTNCTNDSNQTIFSTQTSTTIVKKVYFGYQSNADIKKPLQKDNNTTLKIGSQNSKIFFIKDISPNSSSIYLSFGLYKKDGNQTERYISKWIKIDFKNSIDTLPIEQNKMADLNYDKENAKSLFIQNCTACHRYNNNTTAPKGIAPILTNIGGWGNRNFIKESLLEPDKTINPKFAKLIQEGKIMPMPSFDWMEKKNLQDLINFLQNLKAK